MPDATPHVSMAAFLAEHLNAKLATRFWAKVDKSNDCWLWTGSRDTKGYGRISVGPAADRHIFNAHRVVLALCGEMPPDDLFVCHHCDNPPCVRPAHLFVDSHAGNMADMIAKGRQKKVNGTGRCKNGHLLTDENTRFYYWRGQRLRRGCLTCLNA